VNLFAKTQRNTLCWWFQQNSLQITMCCRPKVSFLIDDILQHSSSKPPDVVNSPWPARPTPVYLNQMSPMLHTSEAVRVPTLTSATRGVYMTDVFGTQDGLRIYNSSYQSNSQPLADSIMDGPYRGMWVLSTWGSFRNISTLCTHVDHVYTRQCNTDYVKCNAISA